MVHSLNTCCPVAQDEGRLRFVRSQFRPLAWHENSSFACDQVTQQFGALFSVQRDVAVLLLQRVLSDPATDRSPRLDDADTVVLAEKSI